MRKKLPDLIENTERLALIIGTAPGLRFHEPDGTVYKTGQTGGNINYVIDIYGVVDKYVDALSDRNMGRAMRLVDYLRGKAMGRFPWGHRDQLREDIAGLIRALSGGGYGVEE